MSKKVLALCILFLFLICTGCSNNGNLPQIAATTLPVYEFTVLLCQDTDIHVTQVVTESISCLHDYTLKVSQMRALESAEITVISGAGLEEFLDDALDSTDVIIDASAGVPVISLGENHSHTHDHLHEHSHEHDPHIWLSPDNAIIMAENICAGLTVAFPQYTNTFKENLVFLKNDLEALKNYGTDALTELKCRDLITFHDGFAYLADAFNLHILKAVEEESGSEAAASEIIEIIDLINTNHIPAIFTEYNGSTSAASIIKAETNTAVFELDMAIAGESYFQAMYHNIDTLKEALG